MTYLSLFSGIGAFEKALENLNISYDLIGFSEIEKAAVESYCVLHNISKDKNLGDITKIEIEKLPKNIDLLTHGSPCQSFSLSGKNLGGDKGSETPSSLLWNSVEIIKWVKPKVVIWENVENVLSKKHKHNFDAYLDTLKELGYENKYEILNAKYFGVPQNRNRIICVSILDDTNIDFSFENIPLMVTLKLKDILDEEIPEDMYFKKDVKEEISKKSSDIITVGQTSNKGSQAGKVYSIEGVFPTVCAGTHGYALGFIKDKDKVRRLTPSEVFKLMGFTTEDCEKCKSLGLSKTSLYKQAGNSIVVPVLEYVFKRLYQLDN